MDANKARREPPLLEVAGAEVLFPVRRGILARTSGHVRALGGVTLEMACGETLGLAGESGCGKTTLGRVIAGLQKPTAGRVSFRGQALFAPEIRKPPAPDWRRRIQMVFQDPLASMNPRMTICDLLTEGLAEHRMLGGETREEAAVRLLGEVGLSADALWKYPFEFSGGQRQRICIARALSLRPELVVCDEVASALDVSVQAQVINLLSDLRDKHGLAYLMISHDLSVLRHASRRIAVMYLGKLAEVGPSDTMVESPKHPYTQALVAAVPVPGVRKERRALSGEPPSAARPPAGCPFHTRCPRAMPICRSEAPAACEVEGHRVWCHLHSRRTAGGE